MHDDVDDFESPYFDWENNRLFDEPTQRLIDRIANDPRFRKRSNNVEIVEELAPQKSEDEQESLRRAAAAVFDLTVFPVLKARALQLVDEALSGPHWEALLPTWMGEAEADSGDAREPFTDPDPRVLAEFTRRWSAASEEACARVESEARQVASELPRPTRDLLVLANRMADRESLLEPWIEGASQRRRCGTAYYAQRIVRMEDEDTVWDRYSAAAKILAGQGWTRKAIAKAIGIGVGRIDRLLERSTGQDIADDDPLCDLVPELRGRGEAWRDVSLVRARKPRPFSRLSVDEKVELAEQSTDPGLLDRLAKQGSGRITEALLTRYRRRGDVGEDVLHTILSTSLSSASPWMRRAMIEAHHQRPMPKGIVIALAEDDARVLLDCDDATAHAAKGLGRKDFDVVLAFRESDTDALERMLTAGSDSESFWQLVDLLIKRPLTDEMIDSSSLLTALLRAAERTDDVESAAEMRLIACQSPEVLSQYIDEVKTGARRAMLPEDLVEVAFGSYDTRGPNIGIAVKLSGSSTRKGVEAGARALWEAADLTIEHRHARKVVAERGSDAVSLESPGNIYVATADAIRCFPKSRMKEYTYVHMRLTPSSDIRFGDMAIRTPHELPTLGYQREMRRHPADPDGPDVEVIVWPIPVQPAIYSLDIHSFGTELGMNVGLIAVSGSKVAIVEDL